MSKRILFALRHPSRLLAAIWGRIGGIFPDSIYLRVRYLLIFGKWLRLNNPKTFNEKIAWLKIYNQRPEYVALVDKAEVKRIVSERMGSANSIIIPTYGIWDRFEDIDFDSLPEQFVMKATNGRGGDGVIICRDKNKLDKKDAKRKIEHSMKTNWKIEREWVYRDIKPRIIVEELLQNSDGSPLNDWKLMCFNGEPLLLFYASDRFKGEGSLRFDWYDMDLRHLPITSKGIPRSNREIPMFPEWEEMKNIARQLSAGMPHVRVDLYLVDHKIYFSELTFFHDGGAVALEPEEWEYSIGNWLALPEITKKQ